MKNLMNIEVLCVPRDHELVHEIINPAHENLGHFGEQKTAANLAEEILIFDQFHR